MALVKIKHPITIGNDSGFALIDSENLQPHHEVLETLGEDNNEPITERFIKSAMLSRDLFSQMTDEEKNEAYETMQAMGFKEIDEFKPPVQEIVEPVKPPTAAEIKAAKAVEAAKATQASPAPITPVAPAPGAGVDAASAAATGWAQPIQQS